MKTNTGVAVHPRFKLRMRAIAILGYGTVEKFYKKLPQTQRDIFLQIARGTLSQGLADSLKTELGPDRWRFLVGERDTLIDKQAPVESPEAQGAAA